MKYPYVLLFAFFISINYSVAENCTESAAVTLVCPSDVWLPCGSEIWDLSNYGTAYYYINGNQYHAGSPTVSYDLTTCQTGKIYRTWSVEDYDWNIITCTQTIYINGGNFNYYNIHWPGSDIQLYGCNVNTHPDQMPEGYGRPEFDYVSCSMVGSSYKDQVFYFGPDCKKILRKWTVLDWCNYYPGNGNPGIWTFTQTIKVSNNEPTTITCPESVEFIPENCDGAYVNLEDVLIDGDACYGEYELTNNSLYAENNIGLASGFYPIGKTIVEYSLEYACGEKARCQQEITVKEKRPVPYCLSQLNIALMPQDTDGDGLTDDGMVELWAKDMDYGSYHPCYPNENLTFSFSSNTDSTFLVFTCADVGINELQLWVTDSRGNQSWCAVSVDVQNNAANIPNCEPVGNSYDFENFVKDIYGEAIENVSVSLYTPERTEAVTVYDTVMKQVIIDSTVTANGLVLYFYDDIETVEVNTVEHIIPAQEFAFMTDGEGYVIYSDLERGLPYVASYYKITDKLKPSQNDLKILTDLVDGKILFDNSLMYYVADINEDKYIDVQDVELLEEMMSLPMEEWSIENQWAFCLKSEMDAINPRDIPFSTDVQKKFVINPEKDSLVAHEILAWRKGILAPRANTFGFEPIGNNHQLEEAHSIYPNPFVDRITFSKLKENTKLEIYDSMGKIIHVTNVEGQRGLELSTSTWTNGTYYYRLSNESEETVGKLIKL